MKAFIYFLIFSFFSPFVTFASVITPTTDCDTLISAEGRMILVEIVAITDSSIRFRACEPWKNGIIMEQPLSAVQEIRQSPKATDSVVLTSSQEKIVNIFTTFSMLFGIGPIVFGLLALLIPIGVPVLVPVGLALPVILGMICSIIVLRLTKQSKLKHKKHRRLAMLGLLGSLLQAYTYIILVSLIFIFKDIEILNDIE